MTSPSMSGNGRTMTEMEPGTTAIVEPGVKHRFATDNGCVLEDGVAWWDDNRDKLILYGGTDVKFWDKIANIKNAKLKYVINPPAGFLEWAKENGAEV